MRDGRVAARAAADGSAPPSRFAAGGSAVGDIVTLTTTTGSKVTWGYLADPEGNIVELQRWD